MHDRQSSTPEQVERLEDEISDLREALRKIDRLAVIWDAPLKHEIGDHGEAAWAVVGSEASMIAHLALGGSRESARARLKETR